MTHWKNRHTVIPAVYVLLHRDGKVLLIKRQNTGYRDDHYSLPAGHLEGSESAVMAAVREAKEEVDIDIKPENLHLVHTQHRVAESGDHERISLYFEAHTWHGEPVNAEPDKCSELRWVDLNDLPKDTVPELKHFFRHYAQKNPYGDFDFN
jgi:8-oxo-dGTP pyrophosphatase MutT (NUDIX family)